MCKWAENGTRITESFISCAKRIELCTWAFAYGRQAEQVIIEKGAKQERPNLPLYDGTTSLGSTLFPLEVALDALVEDGGRLVSRPDLNLHEVGTLTPTMTHVWALHRGSVGIFESFSAAKNVVYFLAL